MLKFLVEFLVESRNPWELGVGMVMSIVYVLWIEKMLPKDRR